MSQLMHLGGVLFQNVLQTTWQAAVLAALILAAQWLFRKRLSPFWRYGLWLLLVIRLLMPVSPQSAFSVFNLTRTTASDHPVIANRAPILSESIESKPAAVVPTHVPEAVERREALPIVQRAASFRPAVKIDWFAVASCGWLAGVCFFGARMVWTNGRFRSRLRNYRPVTGENAMRLLRECREAFKIKQPVRLIESEEVESPAVYGFWRKWLLLPDGVFERFSTEELRCIFLHELAHIKRRDLGINWLVSLLQVLHWFNPFLWLAWARMRADRELATDALALTRLRENDHAPYGETILKVLEGLSGERGLPGLVGIVENKAQLKERLAAIARPGKYWKWAALIVAVLIAGVGLTGAQSGGSSKSRADLSGSLALTDGAPVKATVFIWTAGPKVGTSPFCPGCYPDCGKRAKTDGIGHFKVASLDSQLLFRVLVVGEGIKPKFIEKVDPVKGPLHVSLEAQNLADVPPALTLRGKVVDAKGAPIEAAVIQARGIRNPDGGERWGALRVVDPLAVSDKQGRFVLTSREPFTSLGVWVEAHGFAPKAFRKLDNENKEHELVMTEGASLKGRVLFQGKPLTNVLVVTFRDDPQAGNYHGRFEVGTDAEGRFQFLNMPPSDRFSINGQMSSLQNYGSIQTLTAETGADGSVTDVGDLSLQPAFRISGRVVLSDGQPLPAKTRLVVSSGGAGALTLDMDKDGNFATGGVAPGTASVSVMVPGYHWSLKNASLDQLNPGRLVGRVEHDITNLVLLMDKGSSLESYFEIADGGPQPRFNTLKGVENGDVHSRWRKISGRLTDAKTGEAIDRFRVTPARWGDMRPNLGWNPNLAVEGSNGNYVIEVEKRDGAVELKFEADGYLPAATPPLTGEKDHCDFGLTKGDGPSGTVLLPDGKAAVGVKVLLTSPQGAGPLLCLIGGGNFQAFRNEELLATTDADGHFSFDPRFGMKAVAASGSAGFKMVPVESLRTNANITLEPWGTIKGILHRPSGPGSNEAVAVRFAGSYANQELLLAINATTDDKGAFEFDHVPPGDCEIETTVSAGEDVSDIEHLKKVHVPPGQTMELSIKAPTKTPPKFLGRRGGGGQDFFPPIKTSLHGTVLLPGGKPAGDAQVGLKIPQQDLHVGDGDLEAGPLNDSVVRTEVDGSFTMPMRDGATALYAANDGGFAKVPRESWTNGVRISLQPWGRVEGVLRLNNRPAPNQKVEISEDSDFETRFNAGGFRATTMTDDQGHFVFAHVPGGGQQLSRSIPFGKNGWMSGNPTYISVRSGETTNVTIGGKGRPVVGKCVVVNQKDVPEDPTFVASIHRPYSESFATMASGVQVTSAKQRREQRRRVASQSFGATVSADGSFQVDDVVPGTYEIDFTIRAGEQRPRDMTILNSQPKQIVVPALADPEKSEPLDLGVLKTAFTVRESPNRQSQANSHSLKTGDSAPAFETKALDGRPLRLGDYRAKFVLLDIRFMLPGNEMEGLESVNGTFGSDDRFVIISLCKTADAEFLKNLSSKGVAHWVQGNLDFEAMGGPYGLNGAPFPLIMLIDPQGKIVATALHGDAIQSTVAAALGKK